MTQKLAKSTASLSFVGRLRLFPRYMRDRTVPMWKKFLLILGLAYIISPVDAFPELFLPIIGWLDDVGLLAILVAWTYREIDNWSKEEKEEPVESK